MSQEVWCTPGIVESEDEEIYYEVTSCAEPAETIVLGHGGAGSHAFWYQNVPALAQKHRVIAWDVRGFGRSTLRTGRFGVEHSAHDLLAILDAEVGDEPVHLCGHSMGGWFTTGCAFARPDRVKSIINAGASGGMFPPKFAAERRKLVETMGNAAAAAPRAGRPYKLAEDDSMVRMFGVRQIIGLRPPPWRAVYELNTQFFDIDEYIALGIPTIFINGPKDAQVTPEHVAELAKLLNARVITIEGAGHSNMVEQPEKWNTIVLDYLAEFQ